VNNIQLYKTGLRWASPDILQRFTGITPDTKPEAKDHQIQGVVTIINMDKCKMIQPILQLIILKRVFVVTKTQAI
jgi:hypothetical protein